MNKSCKLTWVNELSRVTEEIGKSFQIISLPALALAVSHTWEVSSGQHEDVATISALLRTGASLPHGDGHLFGRLFEHPTLIARLEAFRRHESGTALKGARP